MADKSPKGGTITIASPMGGWTPQQYGVVPVQGVPNPNTGIANQYSQSTNISLHRGNFIGHIAPGECFTPITDSGNYLSGMPLNGVSSTDITNLFYAVLDNSNLVAFNATQTLASYSVTISGAQHSGQASLFTDNTHDILNFTDATGVEYILWTWDSTNGLTGSSNIQHGDISIRTNKNLSAGTLLNNIWFSGTCSGSSGTMPQVLSGGVPLMLAQGFDGNIYCTNGQYVASAVGINTDILSMVGSTQALNLGSGWTAQSITNYGDYLAIIATKSTGFWGTVNGTPTPTLQNRSRVYLWRGNGSGQNLTPADFVYEINDFAATGIIQKNGVLYIWSAGQDRKTHVKYLSPYNKFEDLFAYDTQVIGGLPKARSIEICRDMLVWADQSNQHLNTLDANTFHREMNPNNTAATPGGGIGMVRNLDTNGLYIGCFSNNIGAYSIMQINEGTYNTTATWFSNLIEIPYKSTIRKVKIYFSQFSSTDSSVQVALMKNYNSSAFGSGNDLLATTVSTANFPNVATDLTASIVKTMSDMTTFYIGLNFNHSTISKVAAIVRKIEIEYEEAPNV